MYVQQHRTQAIGDDRREARFPRRRLRPTRFTLKLACVVKVYCNKACPPRSCPAARHKSWQKGRKIAALAILVVDKVGI
jgi:hypothetical protein